MKVVVVGGGFAGLAAAARLCDEQHQVVVLERRPQLGGRAYSLRDETTGDLIDNGQHLFMGCYRALRAFLRRIGSEDKLRLQDDVKLAFLDDAGAPQRLRASRLPAPLHMLSGLMSFRGLPLPDRLGMLRVARALHAPPPRHAASDYDTVDAWLDRLSQSKEARQRFWYPLTLATLNDDPHTASAKMLANALREALFETRDGSRLGVARGGLSGLYLDDARQFIEARGGEIRTSAAVETLEVVAGVARGVRLKSGESLPADAVICAVPPAALHALIPAETREGETYFSSLLQLSPSPIVSVYLWFDRLVTDEEMLGLCGRPAHWIFNRNRLSAVRDPSRSQLSLIISAARSVVDADADAILTLAVDEVRRAVPAARGASVVHSRVLKEREATIAHTAGTEGHRPRVRSPIDGLFVAGDFVRTGLPATIESAVRSADEAVSRVLEYQPRPEEPARPSGSFVPLLRLRTAGPETPSRPGGGSCGNPS